MAEQFERPPCKKCGCVPHIIFRQTRTDPKTGRVIRARPGKRMPIPVCPCTSSSSAC